MESRTPFRVGRLMICLGFLGCTASSGGCLTQEGLAKGMAEIEAEDRARNEEVALAMGQREFDVDRATVFKALIAAFSSKNMAVVNLDKDAGYLLAEGTNILPAAKLEQLGKENVARLNKKFGAGRFQYVGMNSVVRVVVNIFEIDAKRTRIKMGLSNTITGNYQVKCHELPPSFTTAFYEELWREIDRAMFITQEAG